MTPDALLALLLFVQTPGRSPYSKIFLDDCDDSCQQTPRCEQPVLYCRAPVWSAKAKRHFRYESWAEGVRRYAFIADVVAETSRDMTWRAHDSCPPPHQGGSEDDSCRRAYRARPWAGEARHLQLLVTTVMSYESMLRRDVHEGRTRGDCDYVTVGGRRRLIEGSCRSHCLGQVMVLPGDRTARGYAADELVGLDRASTRRCLETVIDRLSSANNACVAQRAGQRAAHPACTMGLYGGVASWASDERITARSKTFHTIARLPTDLDDEVLRALGRPLKKR